MRGCVVAVQMAFMLMERNSGNSTIDYPIDGSKGIVDALVRGIEKYGGRVMLRARVEEVLVEGGYMLHCSYNMLRRFATVPALTHWNCEARQAPSRHLGMIIKRTSLRLPQLEEVGFV